MRITENEKNIICKVVNARDANANIYLFGSRADDSKKGGSLIDVLNRACKRDIVNSTDEIREIRNLRNEIAHNYVTEDLKPFLTDIKNQIPILLEITNKIKKYTEKYL